MSDTRQTVLYVPARVCEDKRIAELVIKRDSGMVEYIVFDPNTSRTERKPEIQDGLWSYQPPKGADDMCLSGFGKKSGAVLLPTEALPYGSEETLIAEVRGFIHTYVDLDEADEIIAAHYVLFTWLFDRFDEVPYLRFFSPEKGCGKSRALETIGSICYRPIVVGGSSTAAVLRRVIDLYRGTLVGDEQDLTGDADLTSTFIKVFNQGFQRGKPILICGGSSEQGFVPQQFDVYGPKVVVTRTKYRDDAVESRFLTVPMRQRQREDIPINLPRSDFNRQALELRNKLLQYRFTRFHDTQTKPSLSIAGVQDRLNQIAIPLLSTIGSEKAREDVVNCLQNMNRERLDAEADTIAFYVVEYLSRQWRGNRSDAYIKDITMHLNRGSEDGQSLSQECTGQIITGKKVGSIVREQLRLMTKRANDGYYIVRAMSALVELEKRYRIEVATPPTSSPRSPSADSST